MKVVKLLTVTAAAMFTVSGSAVAQAPWMRVSPGNGLLAELDTSSVRQTTDGLVLARVREFSGGGVGRVPPTYTVELTQVDCQRNRSRVLEIRDDANGKTPPRVGIQAPDTTRWSSYSAGSLGGEIQAAVCRSIGSAKSGQRGSGN
jgi:hypothetical protein